MTDYPNFGVNKIMTDRWTDGGNDRQPKSNFFKAGLKIMSNNSKLDLVNMNAYIKFSENMSSSSQDIKQKPNFGINKGP